MRLPSVWQTGATSKNTCPLTKESERCCKLGQQMLWISKIHPSNFGTCLAWNFSLLSASWWSFPMQQYQAWRDKKHECPCRWFSQNVYDMQMATSIPLPHYTPVISQAHQFSIFAETLLESHCQDCPTKQISVLNSKAQHWIRSTWQCQSNPWHSEANDSSTDARLWPCWWKTLHCCREAKNGGQNWNKLRHNGGITIVMLSRKRDGISPPRFSGVRNRLKVLTETCLPQLTYVYKIKVRFKKQKHSKRCRKHASFNVPTVKEVFNLRKMPPIPQQGSHVNPPLSINLSNWFPPKKTWQYCHIDFILTHIVVISRCFFLSHLFLNAQVCRYRQYIYIQKTLPMQRWSFPSPPQHLRPLLPQLGDRVLDPLEGLTMIYNDIRMHTIQCVNYIHIWCTNTMCTNIMDM